MPRKCLSRSLIPRRDMSLSHPINHTPTPPPFPLRTQHHNRLVSFRASLAPLTLGLGQTEHETISNSPLPSPSPTSPRPLRRRPSSPIPLRHRHGPVDVRLLGVITAAAGATVASTHALRGLLLVLAGEVLEVFDLVLYGWGFLLV